MKRWDLEYEHEDGDGMVMRESADGDWVAYEDHVERVTALERERDELRAQLTDAIDQKDGTKLLLEQAREKARSLSSKADAEALRRILREERRDGIAPSDMERAADEAIEAWLAHEWATNPEWWPSYGEMIEIERTHRGNPLVDVIRRILGLEGAPLSQVLDTLRFQYRVCGPWRSRALRKLSEARKALGCQTEDDVPAAALALRDKLIVAENALAKINDRAKHAKERTPKENA